MSAKHGIAMAALCVGVRVGVGVGVACIAVAVSVIQQRPALPEFEAVRTLHAQGSHEVLLDRDGKVLELLRRSGQTGWQAPWRDVEGFPQTLIDTVIASEDQQFLAHAGVDWLALAASALQSLGQRRGGSTITMQTARLLLGREALPPTLWGKLRQIDTAWALERRWSKQQILEAYLNLAPLRSGVRGFHSAQAVWLSPWSAPEQERTWPLLVAMLPAPQASPAMLGRRSCAVLRRFSLHTHSTHTAASCQQHSAADWALWESVWLQIFKPNSTLASTQSAQTAIDFIANSGSSNTLPKRSTVHAGLQAALAQQLNAGLERMRIGDVNAAAAVLMDTASGEVLAYGSATLPISAVDNNATSPVHTSMSLQGIQTPRTLASTLKPFVYAQALDAGLLKPRERIRIRGREFRQGTCDARPYRPRDSVALYQRHVSPALGLAASSNIAAVDIISRLGPERFESKLHALDLLSAPPAASALCQPLPRYGHALALGAAQGSVLALTNAYRSLANGGLYSPARLWMDTAAVTAPQQQFSPSSAAWVSQTLSDQALRFEAFGPRNALDTPYWSASKTGTSDGSRDNWAVGYTRQHSLGVWIGNTRGEPMKGVFGPSGAAPIWRAIMDEATAVHSSNSSALANDRAYATK